MRRDALDKAVYTRLSNVWIALVSLEWKMKNNLQSMLQLKFSKDSNFFYVKIFKMFQNNEKREKVRIVAPSWFKFPNLHICLTLLKLSSIPDESVDYLPPFNNRS